MANVGLWHEIASRQVSGNFAKGSNHWATKCRKIKTQNSEFDSWKEDNDKIMKFKENIFKWWKNWNVCYIGKG